jgi:FKBP-type peptidyl-prolyl cis-trans isomerase
MKKKALAISVVVSVALYSCVKNSDPNTNTCTPVAQSAEQGQITAFIYSDSIPFTKDSSGVYYHITAAGTGPSASYNSTLVFTYKSSLLNGTAIWTDSTTQAQLTLTDAIAGFQAMVGYFRTGTHIKMIIPSSLAYSCQGLTNGTTSIPANSVLYYDMTIAYIR